MTELQHLLDSARAGLSPTAEETSRGRARLLAAIAIPAALAAAPAPAAAGTSLLVKGGLVVGSLSAVAFAVVLAFGGSSTPAPVPEPPPPPPVVAPAPVITPLPEPEPELEMVESARPERAREAGESKGAPQPRRRQAPPPPPDDSLARELRHLSTARTALKGGDKPAARAALEAYDLEFDDNGQLAAEAAKLAKEASDAP